MKFSLPIFKRGKQVWYEGRPYIVEHVNINGYKMTVKLEDLPSAIDYEKLQIEYTVFDTEKK